MANNKTLNNKLNNLTPFQQTIGELLHKSNPDKISVAYSEMINKFANGGNINGVENPNNLSGANWNEFLNTTDQDIITSIAPSATTINPEISSNGVDQYIDIATNLGSSAIDAFTKTETDRISGSEIKATTGKTALQWGAKGAKIGSMITPGIGTLIGGLAAGTVGAITGNINSKKLQEEQAENLKNKYYGNTSFAFGGPLGLTNNLENNIIAETEIEILANGGNISEINGPSHIEGGIQLTANAEVEGGEAKQGNYIFSDKLTLNGSTLTFADEAIKIKKKYEERPGDGPANRTMDKEIANLKLANDAAKAKEEQRLAEIQESLDGDTALFGDQVEFTNGGRYKIKNEIKKEFLKLSKSRGMNSQEFAKTIYNNKIKLDNGGKMPLYEFGGDLDPENLPVYDENGFIIDYTQIDAGGKQTHLTGQAALDMQNLIKSGNKTPNLNGGIRPNLNISTDVNNLVLPENKNILKPLNLPELKQANSIFGDILPETSNTTTAVTKNKFGNEELALLMSNLPAFDNALKSITPAKTNFNRVTPEEINLDKARLLLDKNASTARAINRENVRGTASSSGQALSALSAGNSSIADSLGNAKLQSIIQEETTNVGIRNQANQTNTSIANQEIIANEQNEAMAKSLFNMALADVSSNTQGFLKDKKLTKENLSQNKRLMSVINSISPNYNWDDDNGELAIKFQKALGVEDVLPKTK